MPDFLQGKVAVVTGASRGLGRAIALALAGAGVRVALLGRDVPSLDETARLAGPGSAIFPCDVTQEADVALTAARVAEVLGRVQILVNNAGVNLRKPVDEFTLQEWRWVLDTNLTGAFLCTRAFLKPMRGSGYGRIINITSTMSHVSLPHRSAYSASKFGLLGFTKALALELAGEAITANGISPGPFATELNQVNSGNPEVSRMLLARVPMGRWGDPREVGALALHLCSEQASFVTGSDFVIDGGWLAQ